MQYTVARPTMTSDTELAANGSTCFEAFGPFPKRTQNISKRERQLKLSTSHAPTNPNKVPGEFEIATTKSNGCVHIRIGGETF